MKKGSSAEGGDVGAEGQIAVKDHTTIASGMGSFNIVIADS